MQLTKLSPHINIEDALARLIDDEELFMTILGLMLEDFAKEKPEFLAKIHAKLGKEVRDKAHYFKGIANNLSAGKLGDLAQRMEVSSELGVWDEVEAQFEEMAVEFDQIAAAHSAIMNNQ